MSRSCLLSMALVGLLICQPLDAKPGRGGGGPKRGGGPKISRGGGGPRISRGGGGSRKSISPGGGRKSISPQQKSGGGGRKIESPSGKGRPDFTNKGQGKPDFATKGQGKPDFTTKGQGKPDFANKGQGKPDFTTKGQGKPDFANKGKPDFDSTNRGNGQTAEKLTGRDRAVDVQRANEIRKKEHREAIADHLRDIYEKNGNENLLDVADRMDQKALDHYEKRMAKIDQLEGTDTVFDENELLDPLEQPLNEQQIANLDNPILQQNHRFLNEQRKFDHQMEIANKLRSLYEKNGNPNLLNTAARMEEMAANRFASQFTKIFGPDTPIPDPLLTEPLTEPLTSPLPLP